MSSIYLTKGRAPTTSYSQEDTIIVLESQPPLAYSTRAKGKNVARNSYTKGSLATRSILSGSRAVDKGTPTYSIVENTND